MYCFWIYFIHNLRNHDHSMDIVVANYDSHTIDVFFCGYDNGTFAKLDNVRDLYHLNLVRDTLSQ